MTDSSPAAKPRLAYAIATSFGLGYLPKAPGTWGSLLGAFLGWLAISVSLPEGRTLDVALHQTGLWARNFASAESVLIIIVSIAGVWAAEKVSQHLSKKDPQIVVIDEVAGQLITYLGLATPSTIGGSWKYLLAGFILFRVFDIWKPFPARQAESLPGGLGIMADDWIAGIYAALVLFLARRLGF